MRIPVVLVFLLTAALAFAMDVQDLPTWSAEAHVMKGGISRDTVLVFTRTGPGAWKVRADCQITDVRSCRPN